jgi:hypothetical protein
MKITSITVTAGRTFNHPYEQYSNLRPEVVLNATIGEGEDADAAAKLLQQKAEGLVEDHKNHLLKSIRDLYHLAQARQEAIGLERQMKASQERLEEMRKANPGAVR